MNAFVPWSRVLLAFDFALNERFGYFREGAD